MSTPVEPIIEVLMAPERMRKPTMHDEDAEDDAQQLRPDHVHGEAGDQVVLVDVGARTTSGMSMDGQQRGAAGEEQAVDGDDDRGALQVLELGMLDFAVDLGEALFAAHGEHGVAEGHEDAEEAEASESRLRAFEEAERIVAEVEIGWHGQRRQMRAAHERRSRRPRGAG